MKASGNFIIRVYGLFIENNKILLSDEFRFNKKMTKFPGGGLKFGEGTIDCLKRECMEELNQEIEILAHFYTTDYFQEAWYFENHQLISIYYLAKFIGNAKFKLSDKPFDFTTEFDGVQSFRWAEIKDISEEELTFPIDRKVLKMLKSQYL